MWEQLLAAIERRKTTKAIKLINQMDEKNLSKTDIDGGTVLHRAVMRFH